MKPRPSHWIVPVLFACATVLAWPLTAESASKIVVAPMRNKMGRIDYPRLRRFPDARVVKRVNEALAQREAADRSQRSDCIAMLREQGQKPDKDSFAERIDVRYLSPRYLSIEVHLSYFCGTAYPTNDDAAPITFDLKTGTEVDCGRLFKAGFLPSPGDADAGTSQLGKLYQARYAITKIAADIAEPCKDAISSDAPFRKA